MDQKGATSINGQLYECIGFPRLHKCHEPKSQMVRLRSTHWTNFPSLDPICNLRCMPKWRKIKYLRQTCRECSRKMLHLSSNWKYLRAYTIYWTPRNSILQLELRQWVLWKWCFCQVCECLNWSNLPPIENSNWSPSNAYRFAWGQLRLRNFFNLLAPQLDLLGSFFRPYGSSWVQYL